MNRRDLLRAAGAAAAAGLAGCSTDDDGDPATGTPSATPTTGTETATPTETPTPADRSAPVVDAFSAQHTDAAGDVAVSLDGHDDEDLASARVGTPADEIARSPDGTAVTVDTTMEGDPGRRNQVTARLKDAAGNTGGERVETYVRTYDVLEDTRLDVAVDYFQLGERMFSQCLADGVETQSDIAYHDSPIQPRTTSKQVDAMRGFGITRLQFTFGGSAGQVDMLENFLSADLVDDVGLIAGYYLGGGHRLGDDAEWREKVEADMPILQDRILGRDNAARQDGRPIFLAAHVGPWVAAYDYMMDEWGSYGNFVDDLRATLAVDGTEPYMIAGYGSAGYHGYGDEHEALARHFDAVGSGKAGPILRGTVPVDETLAYVEENYRGHRELADEHDLDFVPLVFPGFDDRANTCWGDDRHIPRSPDRFASMLALADDYRTTDLITIDTWNDWTEGTQIEPGTFRGTDYGTAYLEIIEQFQRGETE